MFPIKDSIPSIRFPLINIILILANFYFFFVESTTSDAFTLHYALIPSQVNLSDTSTLLPFVTAIFLHANLFHLLSNMIFLWVFGDNVEGYLPFFVYPILYFASGILGNVLQYIISPYTSIPMLGASGAIAGVLGAYFLLFPHAKIRTFVPIFGFFTLLNLNAKFLLGYWIVLQLISGAVSLPFSIDHGGVAFFAHIGGFITGFLIAKLFHKTEAQPFIEGQVISQ